VRHSIHIRRLIFIISCSTFFLHINLIFFQAEDGIRDRNVTGVQTCALPISSGESIFAINRKMLKETSRPPFYEQLRLLVISEEVALDGDLFASMLDLFIRDQEMRRIIKVIIAEDKAKDVLEVDPKPEKLPVVHVD